MEKSSAHYKLSVVRALVTEGRLRFTTSASRSYRAMGLSRREVIDILARLERSDLYKSMTTHADHRVWQDVYHPVTPYGSLYLKLSVIEQLVLVSFKVL